MPRATSSTNFSASAENKMNVVVQEEVTGCGLASVAMVAGKGYAEVKVLANRLGIFAEDNTLYSDTGYVRRLLTEYGVRVGAHEKPFSTWAELPSKALLAIKYHFENGRPFWHWVVFERSNGIAVVLDPARHLAENRRTDFAAMQPKWFIEIGAE